MTITDGTLPVPVYPDGFDNNVNMHPFDWSMGNGNDHIDKHPPQKPKNLTLVEVAGYNDFSGESPVLKYSAVLSWDDSKWNEGVIGYRVYQDGAEVITFVDVPSVIVVGLTASTSYDFSVTAVDDSFNESGESDDVVVTTGSADVTPPSVPPFIGAGALPTPTSVYIDWDQSSDDTGVAGYKLYKDGVLTKTIVGGSDGVIETSAAVHGLTAATQYVFTVKAFDAAGNISTTATFTTTTASGSIPIITNFSTSGVTSSSVHLEWDLPTGSINEFVIISFGSVVANVVDGGATSYTLTGLPSNHDYELVIRAVDSGDHPLSESIHASVTTAA
jgi:hypothetical protein